MDLKPDASYNDIKPGDTVLMKQCATDKLSTTCSKEPLLLLQSKGIVLLLTMELACINVMLLISRNLIHLQIMVSHWVTMARVANCCNRSYLILLLVFRELNL